MTTDGGTLELTEFDLGVLRVTGFPLATSVQPVSPSNEEVFGAVVKVLNAPSARTAEAGVCALLYLASEGMERLPPSLPDSAICRRLGFLLDELKTWQELPPKITETLERWSQAVPQPQDPPNTSLGLSARMSPLRLKRLVRQPTPAQARWGVYGTVELRSEVLSRFVGR